MTFTLNYTTVTLNSFLDYIFFSLLIISVLYFICSATTVIKTLIPVPFTVVQLSTTSDDKIKVVSMLFPTKTQLFAQYLIGKMLNENTLVRTGNNVYSAFKMLRNGLILFSIYFAFAVFQKSSNTANSRKGADNDIISNRAANVQLKSVSLVDSSLIFVDTSIDKRFQDSLLQNNVKE